MKLTYEELQDPNYGDPNARPDIAVIPLALSERGIRAIDGAGVPGLLDEILANSRPIYTRLIHVRNNNGSLKTIPMVYGPQGQVRKMLLVWCTGNTIDVVH
jgi:kynurenine 3-monooxygenase